MRLLNSTSKENNHFNQKQIRPLTFKTFQMEVDSSGVLIHISANSLKKGNHTVTVQDGMLCIKIKRDNSVPFFYENSFSFGAEASDIDFQIRLPDKKKRYLNSVRFENDTLKIHLTENKMVAREFEC